MKDFVLTDTYTERKNSEEKFTKEAKDIVDAFKKLFIGVDITSQLSSVTKDRNMLATDVVIFNPGKKRCIYLQICCTAKACIRTYELGGKYETADALLRSRVLFEGPLTPSRVFDEVVIEQLLKTITSLIVDFLQIAIRKAA